MLKFLQTFGFHIGKANPTTVCVAMVTKNGPVKG